MRHYQPPEFDPAQGRQYRIRGYVDCKDYYDVGCNAQYSLYSYHDNDWSNYGYANRFYFQKRANGTLDIRLGKDWSCYASTEHCNGWYNKVAEGRAGIDWGDGVNRWRVHGVPGIVSRDNRPLYQIRSGGYHWWVSNHAGAGNAWYIKSCKSGEPSLFELRAC